MTLVPHSLRAAAALALLLALGACRSAPQPASGEPSDPGKSSAQPFLRAPAISRLLLSPDGKRIAGVSSNEGVQVVFETVRGSQKVDYLTRIAPSTLIHAFGWTGDTVLMVAFEQPDASQERDRASRRTPDGVVSYDTSPAQARRERGREYRMVALRVGAWRQRSMEASWPLSVNPLWPGAVIHWQTGDPERVLINWWPSSEVGASAVLARARDGFAKTVVPATPGMNVWYADHGGLVRAGSGRSEDGISAIVIARRGGEGPFTELTDAPGARPRDFEFAGFSRDPGIVYVYALGATGRKELVAYDLDAKRPGATISADPSYDVGALVSSPSDGALWAVEIDRERPELRFVDDAAQREQASIDAALPGTTNRIVSWDGAAKNAIVRVSGDTTPPDYYRYDRDHKRMDYLFAAYPGLDRAKLAAMKPVRYAARDGLAIPAYLTTPPGAPAKGLPVIVLVHDGPSQRASWGWDPVVQFLASRGFAVFQPNFRGSTGYGREHERQGYGQWGLAMQDDLADGVRWLVEQGIANPARVGIYGVGYGGYAALLAAAKSPDLFRAAASYGAVTDLVDLLANPDHYRSTDLNQPVEGRLPGDRDALAALSPARLGAQIRVPVFVAHGLADPIVAPEQARAMISAVEGAGGTVESELYRGELHEIVDEATRISFHEKLAAFFARHLAVASL